MFISPIRVHPRSSVVNAFSSFPFSPLSLFPILTLFLITLLSGCRLHETQPDPDTALYTQTGETPRLERKLIRLRITTEGECPDPPRLAADALTILESTGKLRQASPEEPPVFAVNLAIRVRHKSHPGRVALGALLLYAWPVTARDVTCEVFIDIRKPSGELLGHHYAQTRAASTVWLGYLFSASRSGDAFALDALCRDAVKAAAVKICRELASRAQPSKERP